MRVGQRLTMLAVRATRGAHDERTPVASRPGRIRAVLGIAVTAQSVALVAAALVLTSFVGLAVLSWLERSS